MRLEDVKELHYIAPIDSVGSILQHGILSHNLAQTQQHIDISMHEVQDRRAEKIVPNGEPLHHYANLYFDAHNPMLSKRRDRNSEICVLRISPDILTLPNVIISDRNASSDYARFYRSPEGLNYLDSEKIYAKFWNHQDHFQYLEHKSIKCAEVLVPELITKDYILGAYVSSQSVAQSMAHIPERLIIELKPDLFF